MADAQTGLTSSDRGAAVYPNDAFTELVAFQGSNVAPAVPGPLGDEPTNTLIFQIARKGDLTRNPVAAGLIKVYRAKSPLVGLVASHGYDGDRRLIVSADFGPNGDEWCLSNFYLAGVDLGIPPSPSHPFYYDDRNVRMWTHGFNPPLFEKPLDHGGGIIVVAWFYKLWLYDTAHPGWQVLDTQTIPSGFEARGFGTEFDQNGSTLACSGSNGDGQQSGFSVQLGYPQSGSLNLQFTAITTDPPASHNANLSASWTNTVQTSASSGPEDLSLFGGTIFGPWSYLSESVIQSVAWSFSADSIYTPEQDLYGQNRDEVFGGELNPLVPAHRGTFSGSSSRTPSNLQELVTREWDDAFTPVHINWKTWGADLTFVSQQNGILLGTSCGDIPYSMEFSSTASYVGVPAGWTTVVNYETFSFPLAGSISPDRPRTHKQADWDRHRRRMAWRHSQTRGGNWTADVRSEAPFDHTGYLTMHFDAQTYRCTVVDAAKEVRAERDNFLDLFGGTVKQAGAYTVLGVRAFSDTTRDMGGHPFLSEYCSLGTEQPFPGPYSGPVMIKNFFDQQFLIRLDAASGPDAPAGPYAAVSALLDRFQFAGSGGTLSPYAFNDWTGTWNAQWITSEHPTGMVTAVQYDDLGDGVVVPDPATVSPSLYWWEDDAAIGIAWQTALEGPESPSDRYGGRVGARHVYADVQQIDDHIYVDPRTDGWMAQSFWEAKLTSNTVRPSVETFIGNEDSVTTLAAVLNEIAQLSGSPSEYQNVIMRRDFAKETSLL
jgi:hypothetical protein